MTQSNELPVNPVTRNIPRKLNNWVMHPVARVSIKYWNTSVRNKSFGARFIVHLTLHVSAPIGGHLQVVYKHVKIYSR
jgi:hypothetical protein